MSMKKTKIKNILEFIKVLLSSNISGIMDLLIYTIIIGKYGELIEPKIDLKKWCEDANVEVDCLEGLIESHWDLKSGWFVFDDITERNKKYYSC